ncbi:MAG: CobQ/CobB/MinD/ParA nucleotide binding protein [Clostridiales bacterium]|nr:CobQ/CobB/MinD/ParA nucleotide binding protein [Clostridiales bacterium]
MGRLSLLIADKDEVYIESMVNYLIVNHSVRFQVFSFTKKNYLQEFLERCDKQIDILLICPEFYTDNLPFEKIRIPILLGSGKTVSNQKELDMVNRFQHVEKIIRDVTGIYAEKVQKEVVISKGDKETKVVAVYSPAGGAGKSSISLSASLQCSLNSQRIFYLNLEEVNSTALLLEKDGSRSFSRIIYHLKEKNTNLPLKIEGLRCIVPKFNLNYFSPPQSCADMYELSPEDVTNLIENLRSIGQYDVVFVDMDARIDKKNMAVLSASDEIFFIVTQDIMSLFKAKLFLNELKFRFKNGEENLLNKITVILNKFNANNSIKAEELNLGIKSSVISIPDDRRMTNSIDIDYLADTSNNFAAAVLQLIKKYLPHNEPLN